jgi:serine protease Do
MTRASSAYQAGIQPGDVIVSFNGQKIENSETFTKLLADTKIGSTATVEVLREGRRLTVKVPVTGPSGKTK